MKLSASKCQLFTKEATWCGRHISEKGISFDPSYMQGLQDIQTPKTVADLQQWLCALNWIQSSIPHFAAETEPLRACLNSCVQTIGSSKKRKLRKYLLERFLE